MSTIECAFVVYVDYSIYVEHEGKCNLLLHKYSLLLDYFVVAAAGVYATDWSEMTDFFLLQLYFILIIFL